MGFEIEIVQGDIVDASTEAIVNAANNELWMGSGVAGAIKTAGGKTVEEEAMKKGPIMPGEVVSGPAGTLRFAYVLHAAVMGQDLRTNAKLIRLTTIATLNLAEKLKLRSIAFPAFGTGVGGFPMAACAKIMTTAVNGYQGVARNLNRVQFCLFDALGYQAFLKAVRDLKG